MSKQPTLREALDKLAFDAGAWGANPDNEKPSVDQAEQAIKDLLLSKLPECYKRESNSDYELGLEVGTNDTIDEITKTIEGL